jgi:two-component system, cell cycle sensor histidine kinase and response regulator CckA
MKNILVVDDEPLVLMLLKRVLTEAGFNVLEASSGEEAIEISAGFVTRIHLLLTDLKMPGICGQQLSATLLRQRPDMQVIYMSGYCDRAAAGLNSLDGSVAFLQKPFGRPNLLAAIHTVLPPMMSSGSAVFDGDTAAIA